MSDPFELTQEPTAPALKTAATAHLDGLNPSQLEAVEATEGPVLVLAGAGTGKTRVLTTRLTHILARGLARPWEVLAMTFTNKAAREMQDRVAGLLQVPIEGWWVGTFHAVGARLLRAHAETVGLRPGFTILDSDDQVRLVKQLLRARDMDEKRWPARAVHAVIQRWKDRGLKPGAVSAAEGAGAADGRALELYIEYQDRLRVFNAVDFGDLLLHCVTLLQDHPDILRKYQRQFRYILVDEYQDTNVAQYLWLRLLAQAHRNICCVGDDDQSIYSWRGAEIGNILRFEQDFPGARVIRLERNYRSTPHILAAASGLIAHNQGRLGKTLWTERDEGEKVRVRGVWDGEEEARWVCDEMETLQHRGDGLNQMAVLVRAGFQTREFEERLITLGMPYRVIGGPRFYERAEIRDAVAYLRVIAQPDDDMAFERIVNLPRRGIGPATMQILHGLARARRISLTASVVRLLDTDELQPRARTNLRGLFEDCERWRGLADTAPPAELAAQVLDESGYTAMWKASKAIEAPGKLDNLKELVAALDDYDSLGDFLEHVSLVMDNVASNDGEKVTLMTLHSAKGLEFDTVFLPGWEEGLFPHPRALDEGGTGGLEEERRLAYVGLTRARRRVLVSFASSRRLYGQWQSAVPSRFIGELPPDHLDQAAEPGLYGSSRGLVEGAAVLAPSFRRRRRAPMVEDAAWQAEPESRGDDAFETGQRVFHQKFGYGRVLAKDGDKLEISFEKAGTKKVVDSFVKTV